MTKPSASQVLDNLEAIAKNVPDDGVCALAIKRISLHDFDAVADDKERAKPVLIKNY